MRQPQTRDRSVRCADHLNERIIAVAGLGAYQGDHVEENRHEHLGTLSVGNVVCDVGGGGGLRFAAARQPCWDKRGCDAGLQP